MAKTVKPSLSNKNIANNNVNYAYKGESSTADLKNNQITADDRKMAYRNANLNKISLYNDAEANKKMMDYQLKTREAYKKTGAQTGSIFSSVSDRIYNFFSNTVKPKIDSAVTTVKDKVHSLLEKLGLVGNDNREDSIDAEPPLVDYGTENNPIPEEVTTTPNEVEVPHEKGGSEVQEGKEEPTTEETTTEPTTKKEEKPVFSKAPKGDYPQMTGGYTVTCYEEDGWHLNYSPNPTGVASGTLQKEVHKKYVADGARYSEDGIAVLNVDGEDRYLVAVTPKYGKVGDKINVVLEDGTELKCVIADEKGSDAGHVDGHLERGEISVVELEVSTDAANSHRDSDGGHINPGSDGWPLPWNSQQDIVRIDNYGSAL